MSVLFTVRFLGLSVNISLESTMHTRSLKFFLKLRGSGHTIKLVICAAINGTKLQNIFDILEVDTSNQTARSLLRTPTVI